MSNEKGEGLGMWERKMVGDNRVVGKETSLCVECIKKLGSGILRWKESVKTAHGGNRETENKGFEIKTGRKIIANMTLLSSQPL